MAEALAVGVAPLGEGRGDEGAALVEGLLEARGAGAGQRDDAGPAVDRIGLAVDEPAVFCMASAMSPSRMAPWHLSV